MSNVVLIIVVVLVVLFCFNNFQSAEVWLLGPSVRMPLALLVAAVYLLGMATGSTAVAFVRTLMNWARRK